MSVRSVGVENDAIVIVSLNIVNNTTAVIRWEYYNGDCNFRYPLFLYSGYDFEIEIVSPNERYSARDLKDGHIVTNKIDIICSTGPFTYAIPLGSGRIIEAGFSMGDVPCLANGQGFTPSCRLEASFNPPPPMKQIKVHIP